MSTQFEQLLGTTRVVPVITVPDVDSAVPLAEALVAGGLQVLEITLRTEAGLGSIERIAREVPQAVVGAGTVTTPAAAVRRPQRRRLVHRLAGMHRRAGGRRR